MEQMNHWDRNAPLPETPRRSISWDEAQGYGADRLQRFSPEMAEIAP
jgi:oligoendopeptidase F